MALDLFKFIYDFDLTLRGRDFVSSLKTFTSCLEKNFRKILFKNKLQTKKYN